MPRHPASYELPYHDGLVLLRQAQHSFGRASAEVSLQAEADAAFEWAIVLKEMTDHIQAALDRAESAGDPVVHHALAADPGVPRRGKDGSD